MSAKYGVCDDMGIFFTHDQSLAEASSTLAFMRNNESGMSRGWQMVLESM